MSQPLLKIRNLSKSYRDVENGVKQALNKVSFDIQKGEILSLLGVNGAGKTTLSSLIASLIPPTEGTILWQDRPIYHELRSYRKIIGLCPQHVNLDPNLTLKENLLFQGHYYGLKRNEIEKKTQVLLKRFDLDAYAESKVDILSGGYKQRFLIARTLVHNPKLVILDEPTVGLDPQVRHNLWDFILSLKQEGLSILLTTHYLDEAEKLSDRVCVIDRGQIIIIDTPDNLKSNCKKNNLEEVFLHLLKEKEKV